MIVFDLLLLNGQSLMDNKLVERRQGMQRNFHEHKGKFELIKFQDTSIGEADIIEAYLGKSVQAGCEGLMIKTCNLQSNYIPGRRSANWLKFKAHEYMDNQYSVTNTYDLVVVGADYGTGKRRPFFASLLLACWDDQF
jgi:DNA ligase 1